MYVSQDVMDTPLDTPNPSHLPGVAGPRNRYLELFRPAHDTGRYTTGGVNSDSRVEGATLGPSSILREGGAISCKLLK